MNQLHGHRRQQCIARIIAKLESSSYVNFYVRKLVTQRQHRHQLYRAAAVIALAAIAIGIASTPSAQQLAKTPHPAPVKQVSDRDSGRIQKLPAAYSDDIITISFHNCRENDKHHWSCQRVDGPDTDHYVYIPGLQPSTTRPGIGSTK
jgi:hypothetical protein